MELWDAYDSNLKKIEGRTLIRGDEVPDGIYHLVCEILVQHTDGSYLLMQRDDRKNYGGMWEATAGGSALAGETPLQCAMRELNEETGIIPLELTEIRRRVSDRWPCIYVEFFCRTSQDKHKVTLQEGETVDFRWVSREELLSMSDEELLTEWVQKYIDNL